MKAKVCVISLPDVSRSTMRLLLAFIYKGEVSVEEDDLDELLQAAEALEIRGLTKDEDKTRTQRGDKRKFDQAEYLEALKKCQHVSNLHIGIYVALKLD